MATKKVSAKTVVVEQPVKTAKAAKTVAPIAAEKKAAPATKKPAVAAQSTKATAKVAPAPKKVVAVEKTIATPVKSAAPAPKKAEKSVVVTSKVTFTLPKEAVENAETVAVLGDFNNWQGGVTLKKQKDGSFATALELEKGRTYEFRFLINGEKWENAWNAEAYKPTPFGEFNSVVTV